MPYTSDLVRLAAGATIAISENHLRIKPIEACDVILEGYNSLRAGGEPFVLEERHKWLRALALSSLDQPSSFWKNLDKSAPVRKPVPTDATEALKPFLSELRRCLPRHPSDSKSREAWAIRAMLQLGNATAAKLRLKRSKHSHRLARGRLTVITKAPHIIYSQEILEHAVRCPDPYVELRTKWLVRRLAPDSAPIELEKWPKKRPEDLLLYAMGWEAANIHLGSKKAIGAVRKDLAHRPPDWLREGSKAMVKATFKDWKEWKKEES